VDALEAVAVETGKTVPQVALNWLLQRPTVATPHHRARNELQLRQNLGAVGWNLTPAQVVLLRCGQRPHEGLSLLASDWVCRAESPPV